MVLHQFPNWTSSIVDLQLTSIHLSTIHVIWFLLDFHPLQHSLVDDYNTSIDTPYCLTSGSCMLLAIFFFVLCTPDPYSETLVCTSVSIISTSMFFIDLIISSKLVIPIENNYGFVAKMIFSFSCMIPFWS
jgi:hypothetical protein